VSLLVAGNPVVFGSNGHMIIQCGPIVMGGLVLGGLVLGGLVLGGLVVGKLVVGKLVLGSPDGPHALDCVAPVSI